MHIASLIVAALACGTGLWAASLWWQASRIPVAPSWQVEPGEPVASMEGWIVATIEAFGKSGAKNASAALWTGGSVALSGIAALLGALRL
jgi:hypothetical protein